MPARDRYRLHPLDGAVLAFQPSTGQSIRIETEATEDLRRRAPRVVLFSLSHACNLRCGFCSRDATQRARWTADAAFEALSQLSRAGTLEVSFGGGEPLLVPGFVALLERLHRETALALHFTTNGTRVTPALASRLAPLVGEIRLSVYEEQAWEDALEALTRAGCRVGVNVMVTPESLTRLPAVLWRARALGACDLAALRYVGDAPEMHLSAPERSMLEQALAVSPLPVRLSNCLLDTLPNLPRLFPGTTIATARGLAQDCGAGRDFVVIDPDAGVRSCSFHADRTELEDVPAWLEAYRSLRAAEASPRRGCARPVRLPRPTARGAFVYRSFASNNSGDTLLVARFETVPDAKGFVRRLLGPDVSELEGAPLTREHEPIDTFRFDSEDRVARVGRTLLASGYHSDDALPGLRSLLWDARAMPVYSAIHTHDDPELVVGVRSARDHDREHLQETGFELSERGPILLGHLQSTQWPETLARLGRHLEGRTWAAEFLSRSEDEQWGDAMKHLDAAEWGPEGYLIVRFPSPKVAERVAAKMTGDITVAGDTLLSDVRRWRPRLGQYASREGGCAWWLPRMPMRARLWSYTGKKAARRLEVAALNDAGGDEVKVEVHPYGVGAAARTTNPHQTMRAMQRVYLAARAVVPELTAGVWMGPEQPMLAAARRVKNELAVLP
ncbi:MAG: radical SAM protein [Sandaracinaceae bacterium]